MATPRTGNPRGRPRWTLADDPDRYAIACALALAIGPMGHINLKALTKAIADGRKARDRSVPLGHVARGMPIRDMALLAAALVEGSLVDVPKISRDTRLKMKAHLQKVVQFVPRRFTGPNGFGSSERLRKKVTRPISESEKLWLIDVVHAIVLVISGDPVAQYLVPAMLGAINELDFATTLVRDFVPHPRPREEK